MLETWSESKTDFELIDAQQIGRVEERQPVDVGAHCAAGRQDSDQIRVKHGCVLGPSRFFQRLQPA